MTTLLEAGGVRTSFHVERWDAEQIAYVLRHLPHRPGWEPEARHFRRLGVRPYMATHDENCNLLTQAGWGALLGGIAGTSIVTKFSATAGRIGVGTVTTAAVYSDTKLGGDTGSASTTSYYQLVSSAPAIATGSTPPTLTFTASFGTTVANFAWQEFGIDNGATSGVTTQGLANVILLNHGNSAQGIKPNSQVWTGTAVISFGYPSGSGTVS